jgi:Protein of unknown function (DUF4238)
MAGRNHYVSQFHLRGFIDPTAERSKDPWLWLADCKTGTIKQRSPKNFGWSRGLFDGPGGLADQEATLETEPYRKAEAARHPCLLAVSIVKCAPGESPKMLMRAAR